MSSKLALHKATWAVLIFDIWLDVCTCGACVLFIGTYCPWGLRGGKKPSVVPKNKKVNISNMAWQQSDMLISKSK